MKHETIEQLWYLQTWSMDLALFKQIFVRNGENADNEHSLANHMWRKYIASGHNLLTFWRQCDSGNQRAILEYINSSVFKESYDRDN